MTTPRPEQRLIELVVQTRLEDPDAQEVAELQALLDDPKLRRLYIELVNLHSHLATAHTQHAPDEEAEQAALTDVVATLYASEPEPIHIDSSTPLTRKAYASALSYVVEHTFTPKHIALMATAAAVLLGVVLAIVFMIGGPGDEQPIANTPVQTDSTDEPIKVQPIVATLTAEHDAVWDRKPGEDLFAGQRLQLIDGSAEITTQRGAVAVLEAPATIELIDSPNALRLYSGKLVGICETESSKGFLVRTAHVDVTDLGTRFGVDVTKPSVSAVHVFEGEVELAKPAQAGTPGAVNTRLVKGQASSVNRAGHISSIKAETLVGFASAESLALMGVVSPRQRWVEERERLMRDPGVIAVVPFIRPGSDWPDGFGYGQLRFYDNQYLAKLSRSDAELFSEPVAWDGDRGIGDSILFDSSGAVFIDLHNARGGRAEMAGLINENGLIGQPGTTLYISWRMQGGGVGLDPKAYAGLSLMRGDRPQADEPLFIGCVHQSTDWSAHPRSTGQNQPDNNSPIRSLTRSGSSLQADADAHLWLVRIDFAEGSDRVQVYLDPDLGAPELPEANLEIKDHDVSFDRLRFTIGDGAMAWRLSDLVISTTRPSVSLKPVTRGDKED